MNLDAAQDRREDSVLCSEHEILWEGRVVVSPSVRARLPRFLLGLVGFVVISLAALPASVRAEFPQPQGRVNDFAAVLDEATRTELASLISEAEAASSAEIAVVTVVSLDGMSVEEYASELFAAWGIGKKGVDNGVLVLVAPKDRTMRIEVGYGLEPVLPDSLAGSIIRSEFLPAFKEGDYRAGILKGVSRVAGIVRENRRPITEEQQVSGTAGTDQMGQRPAVFKTLFLWVSVAMGAAAIGSGLRSKSLVALLWGGGFGGFPFLLARDDPATYVEPRLLALLAILMVVVGYRKGRVSSGGSGGPSSDDTASSGRWTSSGSDSSSSGSDSGFGGGSSGGGGASGKW
jgi:uncharacterized protein